MTGAADETGFNGIVAQFDLRGPLYFGADMPGRVHLARIAIVTAQTASAQIDRAPSDPAVTFLMPQRVRRARGAVNRYGRCLKRLGWKPMGRLAY